MFNQAHIEYSASFIIFTDIEMLLIQKSLGQIKYILLWNAPFGTFREEIFFEQMRAAEWIGMLKLN